MTTYSVIRFGEDGETEIERFNTNDQAAARRMLKINAADSVLVERHVELQCTAHGFRGIIVETGTLPHRGIRGTVSNAAPIARAKTIDAAAKRGLKFVE